VENTAKGRLKQLQAMEEEMHNIKQAHGQQMEEMQKQVQYMETQGRLHDQHVSDIFKSSLEEQLCQQRIAQEEEFRRTMVQFQDNTKLMHSRALHSERAKLTAAGSASLAALRWDAVANVCEAELDYVRADRAMLAFLLAQVDQMSMALN
jgi:TolA-binding protein